MENTKKQNLGLALLFSFLIALAGSIGWGLLYSLGWFATIIAYVTAFGMFAVYSKFAKITPLTFVWTLLWVLILNIISSLLAILITVAVTYGYTLSQAMEAFVMVFNQVAGIFVRDIIVGTIFAVLGVVTYYGAYKKKQKDELMKKQMMELFNKPDLTGEQNVVEGEIVESPKDEKPQVNMQQEVKSENEEVKEVNENSEHKQEEKLDEQTDVKEENKTDNN